jgi:hypothetical protein
MQMLNEIVTWRTRIRKAVPSQADRKSILHKAIHILQQGYIQHKSTDASIPNQV